MSLPKDVASALTDGVVLWFVTKNFSFFFEFLLISIIQTIHSHLANHVRPRSVASIHVPSAAVVSLKIWFLSFVSHLNDLTILA